VLMTGLGGWLLTGAALDPVTRMRRRLEEITGHDTDSRLPVPATGDEIAALAITMNGLLERLQLALARQRAFTADAGHELRTPLTALKAELELAGRPRRSRAAPAAVGAAASDTDRLIRLAEDLLRLAGTDEGTASLAWERTDISSELHAATHRFASRAADRHVAISVRATGPMVVIADPRRVRQVLDNLLDNALRRAGNHQGGGAYVRIELLSIRASDPAGGPTCRALIPCSNDRHMIRGASSSCPHKERTGEVTR